MLKIDPEVTACYDFLNDSKCIENHLVGGAGSGKSYSTAQYVILNRFLQKHKILVVRKTLPALRITAFDLVKSLFDKYGLKPTLNKSELLYTGYGSSMLFKGFDDPEKIKSFECDTVWVEEATDLSIDDYRQLKLRLGRSVSDAKIIFTYNPISQHHWLKKEVIDKNTDIAVMHSTYKDNLKFLSPTYIKSLEDLINQDPNYYNIYVLGKWGVLEGIIYNNWDICKEMPQTYEHRFYGVDFGFSNPSAVLEMRAKENDIWIDELVYQPGLTNPELISKTEACEIDKGSCWYGDSAEPDRIKEFCEHGFNMSLSNKEVSIGIDHVKRYKLHITERSLNTIKEIQGYVYQKNNSLTSEKKVEQPVGFNDHACLAKDTLIKTKRGSVPIQEIRVNDKVLTREGFKDVAWSGKTGNLETNKYMFTNGSYLIATKDHPIFVSNNFIPLDALRYGDIITTWKTNKLFLTVLFLEGILSLKGLVIGGITGLIQTILRKESDIYIKRYGKALMEKYQKGIIFTIKTVTLLIMQLKILIVYQLINIYQTIIKIKSMIWSIWQGLGCYLLHGGKQTKEKRYDQNLRRKHGRKENRLQKYASNAEKNLKILQEEMDLFIAQTNVNRNIEETKEWIILLKYARIVGKSLKQVNMMKKDFAQENAVQLISIEKSEKQDVYNLEIDGQHEYYANGILVHNCSALRYGVHTYFEKGELFFTYA